MKKMISVLTLTVMLIFNVSSVSLLAQSEQLETDLKSRAPVSVFAREVKYYYSVNHYQVPNQVEAYRYQNGLVYRGMIPRVNLQYNALYNYYIGTYEGYIPIDPTIQPESTIVLK